MSATLTPAISLFGFTLRQTVAERRSLLAMLLMALPALFALLIRWANGGALRASELWEVYNGLGVYMLLGGVLPMTAMLFGPALITAESEHGTLVYWFTRRLKRWQVLIVRFAAQAVVLSVLGIAAMIALHFALLVRTDPQLVQQAFVNAPPATELRAYLTVMFWAALGFLAVFTLISLLTVKALLVSGLYLVFVEIVLGNLPAAVRMYSISHQIRRSLAGDLPHILKIYAPKVELIEQMYPRGGSGAGTLTIIVAILLVFSAILTTRKELSARPAASD